MPATEPAPCNICMLKTTSQFNFLLNCCICKRGYHHRCCRPPIPDGDLSSLIRASSKNKPGKGIKYWKCYTCRERPLPSAPDPGPSTRRNALMSGTGSSHTEVIVISSDDEEMPEADIVVSNHPLSSRQDTERKHQASASGNAPSTSVVNKSSSSKTPRVSPSRRREDKQMEIDTAPEHPPCIPATTSPQPSTSRFGLLSPPADSRSTTCTRDNVEHTLQHNSECNTGSTNVQPRLDARNPAHAVTVLPTPPVSNCASPPVAQGPRIPPTWLEPNPEGEDDFGVRRPPARLSTSTTSSRTVIECGGRKLRKVKAKPLEEQRYGRTLGQQALYFVGLPR